jgi:hypothetical protein
MPMPTRAQQVGLFLLLTAVSVYALVRAWMG